MRHLTPTYSDSVVSQGLEMLFEDAFEGIRREIQEVLTG